MRPLLLLLCWMTFYVFGDDYFVGNSDITPTGMTMMSLADFKSQAFRDYVNANELGYTGDPMSGCCVFETTDGYLQYIDTFLTVYKNGNMQCVQSVSGSLHFGTLKKGGSNTAKSFATLTSSIQSRTKVVSSFSSACSSSVRSWALYKSPQENKCGKLTPIESDDCPVDGDIPNCLSVDFGMLCDGDGECGTTDVNNCGMFDIYRKAAIGPSGFGVCGSLSPIQRSECPVNGDIANCLDVRYGELCDGDGECDTEDVNNCGNFDIYRKIALGPTTTTTITTVTTAPGTSACGYPIPVPRADCPTAPDIANCLDVNIGELCEGDGECSTTNIDNCGEDFDIYIKQDPRKGYGRCGYLTPISSSKCPSTRVTANCTDVAYGELCTGIAGCVSKDTAWNCGFSTIYIKEKTGSGVGTCGAVVAISKLSCPSDPASLSLCKDAEYGELCRGDGQCDTARSLDNCKSFDVYQKAVAIVASEGSEWLPHCSWGGDTGCTWDSETQEVCAQALCKAQGYGFGKMISVEGSICNQKGDYSYSYSITEDIITRSVANRTNLTALCLPIPDEKPAQYITSDGSRLRPHCTWPGNCTGGVYERRACAAALCTASGFSQGEFHLLHKDMCEKQLKINTFVYNVTSDNILYEPSSVYGSFTTLCGVPTTTTTTTVTTVTTTTSISSNSVQTVTEPLKDTTTIDDTSLTTTSTISNDVSQNISSYPTTDNDFTSSENRITSPTFPTSPSPSRRTRTFGPRNTVTVTRTSSSSLTTSTSDTTSTKGKNSSLPTKNSKESSNTSSESKSSTGLYVGIVIGILSLLVVIGAIAYRMCLSPTRSKETKKQSPSPRPTFNPEFTTGTYVKAHVDRQASDDTVYESFSEEELKSYEQHVPIETEYEPVAMETEYEEPAGYATLRGDIVSYKNAADKAAFADETYEAIDSENEDIGDHEEVAYENIKTVEGTAEETDFPSISL
eukprot:m.60133 g.60133  ORF g.60133 m.60133 type:complete len:962 (-) comp11297_c1_seq3:79-2964(-)